MIYKSYQYEEGARPLEENTFIENGFGKLEKCSEGKKHTFVRAGTMLECVNTERAAILQVVGSSMLITA